MSTDYPIHQNWKRYLFRRGKLPMGDLHDVLTRVEARHRVPQDEVFRKYLSHVSNPYGSEFECALNSIHSFRKYEFLQHFNVEAAAQWDCIVDRRFSGVLIGSFFLVLGLLLSHLFY